MDVILSGVGFGMAAVKGASSREWRLDKSGSVGSVWETSGKLVVDVDANGVEMLLDGAALGNSRTQVLEGTSKGRRSMAFRGCADCRQKKSRSRGAQGSSGRWLKWYW